MKKVTMFVFVIVMVVMISAAMADGGSAFRKFADKVPVEDREVFEAHNWCADGESFAENDAAYMAADNAYLFPNEGAGTLPAGEIARVLLLRITEEYKELNVENTSVRVIRLGRINNGATWAFYVCVESTVDLTAVEGCGMSMFESPIYRAVMICCDDW